MIELGRELYHGFMKNVHPSEYLWAKTKFDTTIFNNASISQLHDSVLDNVNELVI